MKPRKGGNIAISVHSMAIRIAIHQKYLNRGREIFQRRNAHGPYRFQHHAAECIIPDLLFILTIASTADREVLRSAASDFSHIPDHLQLKPVFFCKPNPAVYHLPQEAGRRMSLRRIPPLRAQRRDLAASHTDHPQRSRAEALRGPRIAARDRQGRDRISRRFHPALPAERSAASAHVQNIAAWPANRDGDPGRA